MLSQSAFNADMLLSGTGAVLVGMWLVMGDDLKNETRKAIRHHAGEATALFMNIGKRTMPPLAAKPPTDVVLGDIRGS